jgi:hypothetical protein
MRPMKRMVARDAKEILLLPRLNTRLRTGSFAIVGRGAAQHHALQLRPPDALSAGLLLLLSGGHHPLKVVAAEWRPSFRERGEREWQVGGRSPWLLLLSIERLGQWGRSVVGTKWWLGG